MLRAKEVMRAMPTKRSQDTLGMLRSHKKVATAIGNQVMTKIDPPLEVVARMRMNGTSALPIRNLPFSALTVYPKKIAVEDGVILHMHGGAYVSGGILQCRALISPICAAAGVRAVTFTYRLAPAHPYPAQLEDAYTAYRFLRAIGYEAGKIAFIGESAGGNLALSLARKLREEGEEMPACIALLSPWVDLAQTGESYRTLEKVDATLDARELMENAVQFAGSAERLKDGGISPIYADFTGFPPTLIHCGTHEILLSDSETLEKAMLRDGVDARLVRWAGMCHVFQAFGFEESKASNSQIGAFLRAHLI
ncbi:MAG: alpha/beta hydrolase [Clostridia bacterium]|nr:alpha/beta hydrolase [Clostridia bacterium]